MDSPTTSKRTLGTAALSLRASTVALLYLAIAGLWIWWSDAILARLVSDPVQITAWQSYKGWFFVIISALLLWGERVWSDRRVADAEDRLRARMDERTSELGRVRTQLQIILDNAPVAFSMRSVDNHYMLTNRRWEEFAGVSSEVALGKTPFDVFEQDVAQALTDALNNIWDKRDGVLEEIRLRLHGQDYVFMRASFPLFDEENRPYAAIGLVTDITASKAVEESLRQAEERFRAIFNTVGVGINLVSPQGYYQGANPAFQRMLGYSEAELLGKSFRDITYPPDLIEDERVTGEIEQRPHEIGVVEKRYVRADGSLVWTRLLISAIADSDGTLATYVTVVEDITAAKEAEAQRQRAQADLERLVAERTAELQRAHDELAEAQRIAHVGNWNIDLETNELEWSAESYRIFGFEPNAFHCTRETFLAGVHPDDRPLAEHVRQAALAGEPMDYEHRVVRPNGEIRFVHERGFVVRDAQGKATSIFGTVQDITDRKQAEDEVLRLNQELEARVIERTAHLQQQIAERVRAEAEVKALNVTLAEQAEHLSAVNKELETFTYSVSHDLKAPLRGIDGYSRLLLEDYAERLDEEGQYFLHTIRNATMQMGQLIDDLLSYSRLERRTLAVTQVDVRNLVDTVLYQMQPIQVYPQTKIEVAVEPVVVSADAEALALVLRNLVDNALKFSANSPAPCVEIRGQRMDSAGEAEENTHTRHDQLPYYQIEVCDNGVGFDMQYEERIFEIFQRLHRSEEYPGTGIGLAIVRKALQRMHGRAWAVSQPGQGATFTMEIPIL
jgi:PAS domain S-box-containing protein